MWDSAAYLVAIHGMLSSHWRLGEDVADGVAIRRLRGDGVVETVDRWRHPGARQLPLSALCVQANLLHGQALLRPRSLYKHGGGVVPRAATGGDVDPAASGAACAAGTTIADGGTITAIADGAMTDGGTKTGVCILPLVVCTCVSSCC